ncbi:MAG: hypothetical protein AAGD00_04510 [Planctomycetota bacterium]
MDTTHQTARAPRRTFGNKFFFAIIALWVAFVIAVYVASAIRKALGPPKNVTPNQAPAASSPGASSADADEGTRPNQ